MKSDREIDSTFGFEGAREKAEKELLGLVREEDLTSFKLSMFFDSGKWILEIEDLDAGNVMRSQEDSFAEAWLPLDPVYSRNERALASILRKSH